jgi:hypothetical protein
MEISRREGEDFSRDFERSWQQILCGEQYIWKEKRAAGVGQTGKRAAHFLLGGPWGRLYTTLVGVDHPPHTQEWCMNKNQI